MARQVAGDQVLEDAAVGRVGHFGMVSEFGSRDRWSWGVEGVAKDRTSTSSSFRVSKKRWREQRTKVEEENNKRQRSGEKKTGRWSRPDPAGQIYRIPTAALPSPRVPQTSVLRVKQATGKVTDRSNATLASGETLRVPR
jgi:hypothetical protein